MVVTHQSPPTGVGSTGARADADRTPPPPTLEAEWQLAGVIVEDTVVAAGGTMSRSRFLDELDRRLRAMVSEELRGTMWSGENCPWIDHYLGVYRSRPLSAWQRLIDLWSIRPAGRSAEDLLDAVVERVRVGLRQWRQGRQPIAPPMPPEVGPIAGWLFRKSLPGAGPVDASAVGAVSRLGPGRPLPAGVASRFGPELGSAVSGVVVHDDRAAATTAGRVGARAFAVGSHVAFGAGQYAPNTPEGDALLAHELAHATSAGVAEVGQAERDADRVAERSVMRLWGGIVLDGQESEPDRGRPAGLQLRRCGDSGGGGGGAEDTGPAILTAEETRRHGFSLSTPGGHPTVGRSYSLSLGTPRAYRAPGSSSPYSFTRWYVQRPGQSEHLRRGLGYDFTLTLDAEGEWSIVADIPIGSRTRGRLYHTITVVPPGDVARDEVGGIASTDLTGFLTGLEFHQLQNKRLGMRDQSTEPVHIVLTSGDNPTRPYTNYPNIPSNSYSIRTPATMAPATYRWLAVPEDISDYPRQGRFGQYRRTIEGLDGFDLGGGTSAQWPVSHEIGVVNVHCFAYDASGLTLGHARYRQVMLSSAERERVSRFADYLSEVREQIVKLDESSALHIPAIHIAQASGQATEVSLFIGRPKSGGGLLIVDVTPGVKRRTYAGSAFDQALDDLNQGNSYPDGILRLRVPANTLGINASEWTISTTGESVAQRLSSWSGWASLGLAGLGALSLVIPGAQPLAPVFFMSSAAAGAVSAGASLYQRSTEARPSGGEIAIDVAALAGSLLGLAGAANILRHGPRIAALTRTGRFVLYAGFTSDAVGGVLMSTYGAGQIADVLDGNMSANEKATAIVRILGGMLLNGALLAWGARDLGATRREVGAVIGAATAERLPARDLHAISILEPAAMRRLAGAGEAEIAALARLIREDPVRARNLAERFGEQFVVAARAGPESLEELAQALNMGRPELAGTRGSYGPVPPVGSSTPTPTYGRGPRLSANDIWRKIRAQFINTQSRGLAGGATLHVVGTPVNGTPHTQFELRVPADGAAPAMTIPVRIESTGVVPTSVHGAETGPVGMSIRRQPPPAPGASPGYSASIEMHDELLKGDIANALGHELDELVFIARGGFAGNDITAQKRASLLRPQAAGQGGVPPVATAHDRAAARELAQVPIAQRPAHHGIPPEVERRALEMGFGNTAHLEPKLDLLRRSGVDEDMLARLRTLAHQSDVRAATGTMPTIATTRIIGHLVNATGFSKTSMSPIAGLHLESQRAAYQAAAVANNLPIHLVPAGSSPHNAGWHSFEQWVWPGAGAPPVGSRPTAPSGSHPTTVNGWQVAPEPKTTVDDLASFLVKADSAFAGWYSANPTTTGSNLNWSHTLGNGETIAGWVDIDAGTGAVTHRTVYPARTGGLASW